MGGAVPPLPNTPSWRGAQLGGAQGQLYLYLYVNKLYCPYKLDDTVRRTWKYWFDDNIKPRCTMM
jgi:hypothetical protein